MLEELRNYTEISSKDDLLLFLRIIGNRSIRKEDLGALCLDRPSPFSACVEALMIYCEAIGAIAQGDGVVYLCGEVLSSLDDNDELMFIINEKAVNTLFTQRVFAPEMFTYDTDSSRVQFKQNLLSLDWSIIRNHLIGSGFFLLERSERGTRYYINLRYERIVETQIGKHLQSKTLEELERQLERDKRAGEIAELFVMQYENKRLIHSKLRSQIKQISHLDVNAGYDIASFNSETSDCVDCFIEVKAINKNKEFHISENELRTAKLKGSRYYLYLVQLDLIGEPGYEPTIINNPNKVLWASDDWLIRPESYYVLNAMDVI